MTLRSALLRLDTIGFKFVHFSDTKNNIPLSDHIRSLQNYQAMKAVTVASVNEAVAAIFPDHANKKALCTLTFEKCVLLPDGCLVPESLAANHQH